MSNHPKFVPGDRVSFVKLDKELGVVTSVNRYSTKTDTNGNEVVYYMCTVKIAGEEKLTEFPEEFLERVGDTRHE